VAAVVVATPLCRRVPIVPFFYPEFFSGPGRALQSTESGAQHWLHDTPRCSFRGNNSHCPSALHTIWTKLQPLLLTATRPAQAPHRFQAGCLGRHAAPIWIRYVRLPMPLINLIAARAVMINPATRTNIGLIVPVINSLLGRIGLRVAASLRRNRRRLVVVAPLHDCP